ncbi:hypothetical protein NBRC10513_001069 [Rhodotorula toruloides]
MPTTDLEPPNPAESYPAEALANEELNARSIREVPLQDLVKTIFASRRGSARPPALRRLHATSAIAAGRARGEGAGTLTALAAETGEAGTQEPSGAVAGAEAEASEEEGEGEAGETEAEPATEGEAASKPVKRAKRKYIKDFTKEKGARLDDDIGLVDRGVAKADADAIAASAAAATAAAASASDQLDTGVPGSQASSILSLPRFRDVERTFSRHRPIWVDQDRPDVRMNLCVTVVGATSDRPQVIGSGVSMPGKVLRKAQTSRINGGGKRPDDAQVFKMFPQATARQAAVIGVLVGVASSVSDFDTLLHLPEIHRIYASPINDTAGLKKEMDPVIKQYRALAPQSATDVTLVDQYTALYMEALAKDGVLPREGQRPVCPDVDTLKTKVMWPAVAHVTRLATDYLAPGGAALGRGVVGKQVVKQYNDLVLECKKAKKDTSDEKAGVKKRRRSTSVKKGVQQEGDEGDGEEGGAQAAKEDVWHLVLPSPRSSKFSYPLPPIVPPPPADEFVLDNANKFFKLKSAKAEDSLEQQIKASYPAFPAEKISNVVNAISWLEYRLQGKAVPAKGDEAIKTASAGLVAWLQAQLSPKGRIGQKKMGHAWYGMQNGRISVVIRRGALLWGKAYEEGGDPDARNVFSVRSWEIAKAAIAIGTAAWQRHGDPDEAEREMAIYILGVNYGDIPETTLDRLLAFRPIQTGDQVFICPVCGAETDVSQAQSMPIGSQLPKEARVCPTCADDWATVPRSVLSHLRRVLREEGAPQVAQNSLRDLEEAYIKVWSPLFGKMKQSRVKDFYGSGQIFFVTGRTTGADTTANSATPVASLDSIGPLVPPIVDDQTTLLKHGHLANVVPTSWPTNAALQADPRGLSVLLSIKVAISTLLASFAASGLLSSEIQKAADAILAEADHCAELLVASAKRFPILTTQLVTDTLVSDVLGSEDPAATFLAIHAELDETLKPFLTRPVSFADGRILPGSVPFYRTFFQHLSTSAVPQDRVDRAQAKLLKKDVSFKPPYWPPTYRQDFEREGDKEYALNLIEKLRSASRAEGNPKPGHPPFPKTEDGLPSYLHPAEMERLEEELGRKITFQELVWEAWMRFFRMLEYCDVRYRDVEGADAAEGLFVLFFIDLYIQVMLGEDEDVFGGPVFLLHSGHAFKGGVGHRMQGAPMNLGHKVKCPAGWDDYDLSKRNLVRRRWSSRMLVASTQAMSSDEIRVTYFEDQIKTAIRELQHERPLFKRVSVDDQHKLGAALEVASAASAFDALACLHVRNQLSNKPDTLKSGEEKVAEQSASALKSFISGGAGGVAAVLVGQPFDLTKVRLQTAAPGQYTGALDVVKQTFARDGLRGFYRGMGPPLAGVTPMFAVSFWGYAMGKKLVYALTPNRTSSVLSYGELAAAGFFSAIPTTLVAAPVERVKVLLQMQGQGGKQLYSGPIDAVSKLYREGGLRSIYRGTLATVARDGPGSAAYFVVYEMVKKAMTPQGQDPSQLSLSAVMVAGGSAGVAMWTLAIPPDVVKSRLQGAPEGTYKGFVDCARQTVAKDGVGALFKGFGPAMARAFPANAATFLGVELSMQLMNALF